MNHDLPQRCRQRNGTSLTTIVSAALLTVLWGAAKPEGVPHEIINRKIVPVSVSSLRVVFFFGKIENTLPWHCPRHPLKHPCLVSLPGLLPPAPPSVLQPFSRCHSSLAQPNQLPSAAFQPLSSLVHKFRTGGTPQFLALGSAPSQHHRCSRPPGPPPQGQQEPYCLSPSISASSS